MPSTTTPIPSPTIMSPAPSPASAPSPAALAALLSTALADVDRLKLDLDAAGRRAAAAENVLRSLAPHSDPVDLSHPQEQQRLSSAALSSLIQAENRAGAAEARLQSVLDAWADLMRSEERAAEERKRIDDEARAARRALYPHAHAQPQRRPGQQLPQQQRHPFPPSSSASVSNLQFPTVNGASTNHQTRIRPRTSSDAAANAAPPKRVRNNNWNDRPHSRSPEALAGPGQPPIDTHPSHHASSHPSRHPNVHGLHPHPEPSVEDLILETVERPPRPTREATLSATSSDLQRSLSQGQSQSQTQSQSQSQSSLPKTLSAGGPGPRTCRQCGQPGRYKDGKCVEKWGPGPEGPGTVCDRCRKKMKRVERRGEMLTSNANNSNSNSSQTAALATNPTPAFPALPSHATIPPHAPMPAVSTPIPAPPALVRMSPQPTFSPLPPSPASEENEDIASSKEGDREDTIPNGGVEIKRESVVGLTMGVGGVGVGVAA